MSPYTLRPTPKVKDTALAEHGSLVRRLLLARGVTTDKDAQTFLAPDWERDTHDPFLMKDVEKALKRILKAMDGNERIAIWSDYDMDGIPGAVILYDYFSAVGYENVIHHTPHRNKDGFGLNSAGIDELAKDGVSLIITIDCGISDVDQVAHANKKGLEVIVTDHHLPGKRLPEAYAIVNPKQKDCSYPEEMLCGAGVMFKLVQALITYERDHGTSRTLPKEGWERWLVDMAGMATIADMVPLTGENRTLAYFGLVVLRKSRRLGLQALLKKARADQRHLTEDDVGFTIAPRVNAASRMGHAKDAFALLTARDTETAGAYAEKLDEINTKRKTVVATMKREIKRRLEKMGEPKSIIVMGNPEWKPSLLGLVAGGLAEEYERPVFLWGREEGAVIKGSCRSDGSCSVFEIMQGASKHFVEFGGHTFSGGFSLEEERVHALEEVLIESHEKLKDASRDVEHYYDEELSIDDVTWDTHRNIAKLAPFGEGNPKPVFMLKDVLVENVRMFGKGKEHLEVAFSQSDGTPIKMISFFTKEDAFNGAFHQGATITVLAHLEASYFMRRPELRLRLVDVVKS